MLNGNRENEYCQRPVYMEFVVLFNT